MRATNHDVIDVRGTEKQGIDDDALWQFAQAEGRLVVTTDKGFARFRNQPHHGILVVLLGKPNRQTIHDRVLLALRQHAVEWPGLMVVMRDRVKSVTRRPHQTKVDPVSET